MLYRVMMLVSHILITVAINSLPIFLLVAFLLSQVFPGHCRYLPNRHLFYSLSDRQLQWSPWWRTHCAYQCEFHRGPKHWVAYTLHHDTQKGFWTKENETKKLIKLVWYICSITFLKINIKDHTWCLGMMPQCDFCWVLHCKMWTRFFSMASMYVL